MIVKHTTTITVFDKEQYDGHDWPPAEPSNFIKWFQDKVELIPEKHRGTARIDFGVSDGFYVNIRITYTRLETDEEVVKKIEFEKRKMFDAEQWHLQQLEKIRAAKA